MNFWRSQHLAMNNKASACTWRQQRDLLWTAAEYNFRFRVHLQQGTCGLSGHSQGKIEVNQIASNRCHSRFPHGIFNQMINLGADEER